MANIQFKIPLNKGFEQDNLTSWRKVINSNRGRSKFAKKNYNRRLRRYMSKLLLGEYNV